MRRISTFLILFLLIVTGCDNNWRSRVIEEVTEAELNRISEQLIEDGEGFSDILAESFVGINEKGMKIEKSDYTLANVSEYDDSSEKNISGLEIQPLRPQFAMTTGIHLIKTMHYGEFPRVDSIRFSSVWKKNKGEWKLLSNQYTPIETEFLKSQISKPMDHSELKKYCGSFVLSTKNPMEINIQHINQNLELIIPQHMEEGRPLILVSEDEFQLQDDNWEIEFISEDSIMLNTWGYEVGGRRL